MVELEQLLLMDLLVVEAVLLLLEPMEMVQIQMEMEVLLVEQVEMVLICRLLL
jgi:hypothetical protein